MIVHASFHAECRRCGARFAWRGTMLDMPSCPRCGQTMPREDKEPAQAPLDTAAEDALSRLTRGLPDGIRIGQVQLPGKPQPNLKPKTLMSDRTRAPGRAQSG